MNMTGAGVASLFESQQLLRSHDSSTQIDRGVAFLAKHFEEFPNRFPDYGLYAFSRIGNSGGIKYFGTIDWYRRGLEYLSKTQRPDGSWVFSAELASPSETAFSLLFLDYGSAPVVINKLRYATTQADASSSTAWDTHPQDAANLVRRLGHDVEQRLNWQVVDLVPDDLKGLHDAPILWLIGDKQLTFSADQKTAVKRFAQEGRVILGNALGGSEQFSKSFKRLGEELFPEYEFRKLPKSHPLIAYDANGKPAGNQDVAGLSNGVRELMLLPAQDLSKVLDQDQPKTSADQLHLAEHIVEYATDLLQLPRKGTNHLISKDPTLSDTRSADVVRLKYSGNWDPESAGWTRLAAILHNTCTVDLRLSTGTLGDGSFDSAINAAGPHGLGHLTGTSKISLNGVQQSDLKHFIDAGGTLVIDAAGGSSEFAESVETLLVAMFPGDAEKGLSTPLALEDPIFNQPGNVIDRITYRSFARSRLGSALKSPRIFGIKHDGRVVVYYSPLDLSGGLVGEPIDGICGYSPHSATELMRNIVLQSATRSASATNSYEIGGWSPADVSESFKTMEWKLTADQLQQITGVQFNYLKGAQRLDIEWASIEVDGHEVSRDTHAGYAGLPDHEKFYHFAIPTKVRSGQPATVRASVKCPIGNDSAGQVLIIADK